MMIWNMFSVFMYIVKKWIDEMKLNTDMKVSMIGWVIFRIKFGRKSAITPIPSIMNTNGDTIIPIIIVESDIRLKRFAMIGRIRMFAETDNIMLSYIFWSSLFLKVCVAIFLKMYTMLIVAVNDSKNPESIM